MKSIPWSGLPNVTRIAKEFVLGRPNVVKLLGGDCRCEETRSLVRDARLKAFEGRTKKLSKALRASYGNLEIPPAVDANLKKLEGNNTLAVVTGQQLGLFGGALYSYYKTLTVCEIAKRLEETSGINVVPMFWLASSDSDFSEINHIAFPPDDGIIRECGYLPKDLVRGEALGYHRLTDEILGSCDLVRSWLSKSLHYKTLADCIQQCFQPGKFMVDAFRELYTELFGDLGLIVVDSLNEHLVKDSDEFWENVLYEPERLNAYYEETSKEIEDMTFALQVRLRSDTLPFHYIDRNGMRKRVYGRDGSYKIGPDGEQVSQQYLYDLLKSGEGIFSPAALLRPLYQDWLLPTWIYVAGPGEISYHAQIGTSYDALGVVHPLIMPRLSATLLDLPSIRWMEKHNWAVADVLGGKMVLLRSDGRDRELNELFEKGLGQLEGWLKRIESAFYEAGINDDDQLDKAGRKIRYQWGKLHQSAVNKVAIQNKVRTEHAERLLVRLFPDGILQERYYSPLYFLDRYDGFRDLLIDAIEIGTWEHRIISLGEAR